MIREFDSLVYAVRYYLELRFMNGCRSVPISLFIPYKSNGA